MFVCSLVRRAVLRLLLRAVLSWLTLALLWVALPFPSREHGHSDKCNYVAHTLRSGNELTRVYRFESFGLAEDYDGFALDYQLNLEDSTLSISGAEPLPVRQPFAGVHGNEEKTQIVNVTARRGFADGANLPWFPFADAILLSSIIERNPIELPVKIQWTATESEQTMEVQTLRSSSLLQIQTSSDDLSTLAAPVPESSESMSPSYTYPIRVAIISVLAPTSIFLNDLFGDKLVDIVMGLMPVFFVGSIVLLVFMLGVSRRRTRTLPSRDSSDAFQGSVAVGQQESSYLSMTKETEFDIEKN